MSKQQRILIFAMGVLLVMSIETSANGLVFEVLVSEQGAVTNYHHFSALKLSMEQHWRIGIIPASRPLHLFFFMGQERTVN